MRGRLDASIRSAVRPHDRRYISHLAPRRLLLDDLHTTCWVLHAAQSLTSKSWVPISILSMSHTQRSPPLIGVSACAPQLLCVVRYSHTLRGALLAHAYGLFRVTLQLRAIGNYETVTLCFVFSLFGNNFYAGLTLRARATRGLRRPTSGYRPYVGRL